MKHFRHPNMVNLIDVVIIPKEKVNEEEKKKEKMEFEEVEQVILVVEHYDQTLFEYIRSRSRVKAGEVKIEVSIMKKIVFGILYALKSYHGSEITHREVEPQNILVSTKDNFRVFLSPPKEDRPCFDIGEDYPTKRWYNAVEHLLIWEKKNHPANDIWSVGCIFGELLYLHEKKSENITRRIERVLFRGNGWVQQVESILKIRGMIDLKNDFRGSASAHRYLQNIGSRVAKKVELRKKFPSAPKDAIDLLEKMLAYDPLKRITSEEALKHPFFDGCRENMWRSWKFGKFSFTKKDEGDGDIDLLKIVEYRNRLFEEYRTFFRPLTSGFGDGQENVDLLERIGFLRGEWDEFGGGGDLAEWSIVLKGFSEDVRVSKVLFLSS